jgi:hypothetical protein
MTDPANLEPATPSWRVVAGVINIFVVGILIELTRLASGHFFNDSEDHVTMCLIIIGLVTVYWLGCVLRKKSLGGAFCLLEVRRTDFLHPSLSVHILRTSPYYLLALFAYFPTAILPMAINVSRVLMLLPLLAVLAVNAVFLILTRRSLFDRWLEIVVLRLNLPDNLRPRIFGIRVS